MVIYESIQRLIDATSFSPDTILVLFANCILVYEICIAALYGVVIWAVVHFIEWLISRRKK